MDFGVVIPGHGFFAIGERCDVLTSRKLQSALGASAARRGICCACNLAVAPEQLLRLECYTIQSGGHRPLYRLDRASIHDHHSWDCPFNLDSDEGPRFPPLGAVLGSWREEGNNKAFRRAARRVLSRVITRATMSAMGAGSFWSEFSSTLYEEISRSLVLPYALAFEAQSRGLRLRIGFCSEMPAGSIGDGHRTTTVGVTWIEPASAQMTSSVVRLPAELAQASKSTIRMGPKLIGPPYFVFALVDDCECAEKFALFPIYFDERGLYVIESWYERWRARCLSEKGERFYKPTRIDDLNLFWRHLMHARQQGTADFEFRPDFIRYGQRPFIVEELRGSRPGQSAIYDELLCWKRDRTDDLGCRQTVIFEEVDGLSLSEPDWVPYCFAKLGFETEVEPEVYEHLLARMNDLDC